MQNVDSSVRGSRLTPSTYSILSPRMYSLLSPSCVNDLLCSNGTMMRIVFDEPGGSSSKRAMSKSVSAVGGFRSNNVFMSVAATRPVFVTVTNPVIDLFSQFLSENSEASSNSDVGLRY